MTPTELHIVKLGTLAWLNEVYQRLEELRYCDNDLQYFYELCFIKRNLKESKKLTEKYKIDIGNFKYSFDEYTDNLNEILKYKLPDFKKRVERISEEVRLKQYQDLLKDGCDKRDLKKLYGIPG